MTNLPKVRSVVALAAALILAAFGYIQLNDSGDPTTQLPNNKQALLDNPYHQEGGPEYADAKQLPKHDRPDLALRQFMEMTADPRDHDIHPEKAVAAFREAQRIMSSEEYARNVDLSETVWQERGPSNVGGRTRALMFDPNDTTYKKVWAAGVSGGLWVTDNIDDASTPWQSVDDFWANLAITAMAYDPSNTEVMYIGTGEGFFNINAVRGEGVWKTADGGASWEQLPSTSNNPDFYTIHDLVVLENGAILVATMDNGVMRSLDGGATWSNVLNDGLANRASDLEIAQNGDIYAATGVFSPGNIWKSTDGGTTWTDILPNEYTVQRIELAVAPSDSNVVYALMQGQQFGVSNTDGGGIIKSIDAGANWQWLPNPTDLDPMVLPQDFTNGQGWYNLIANVDPYDPDHVIVGGIDLFQTVDGGQTWVQISKQSSAGATASLNLPVVHADQHAIAFRPGSSEEAIFGNDGGVYLGTKLVEGYLDTSTNPNQGSNNNNGGGNDEKDKDGDGREDELDLDPNNRFICGDTDGDQCDDCSSGVFNPLDDGIDSDGDGLCNTGDLDDDNDGILDGSDPNPLNANICGDSDGDGCDDCVSGTYDAANDGPDNDGDGLCDSGDPDDDNDGVLDVNDSEPFNALACGDTDSDGCDDCINGAFDPNNDGPDNDADGICDASDEDDDNDGIADVDDIEPFNAYVCGDRDNDTCDDCASGIFNPANDGPDNDGDGLCDAGDPDDDNDGVVDLTDIEPFNALACGDSDGDGCDDCASGTFDPSNDGLDTDGDGLCDTGDTDDDNDGVLDIDDTEPLNALACGDSDGDTCDDCANGSFDPANDGADNDGDGICDAGDSDDDNDGVLDADDIEPFNALVCGDSDGDTCDDCANGSFDPANDGVDTDGDGICDTGDADDDNDGVLDVDDVEPLNAFACGDTDGDTCDDCINGSFDPANDGADNDVDGICDAGDTDDDNDGVLDVDDTDPFNAFVCGDSDGDTCDDCASGSYDPANDGDDNDADGICDAGDLDDDNDGVHDEFDAEPFNAFVCGDSDGDTCDDCANGSFDPANDGADNDGDGICDSGDADDDNDGILDIDDIDPLNAFVCGDSDGDTCDDCANGSFDPTNDGADNDADGICDAGDADDDNDGVVDVNDPEPFNALACGDSDGDTCDDCANGSFDPGHDGPDNDGDGICDAGDTDDDNDGVLDVDDPAPLLAMSCGDSDGDGCDDCANGSFDPANDGSDNDEDGICDSGDTDDDNDGVLDVDDPAPMNAMICGDTDGDTCDDCASGSFDPANDGTDNDGDGICDAGDSDDDNDGILDVDDVEPLNGFVCGDSDGDTCDDCANGSFDPANDGADNDGDGICDSGDADDDNDGVLDVNDSEPLNALACGDSDADGCDDCSTGTFDTDNDGADNDADGICDSGDTDDDNDGVLDVNDSDPFNAFVCGDSDADGCDDCASGTFDTDADGTDTDGDGICDTGDTDDDNDGVLDVNDADPTNAFVCGDFDNDSCDDCSSGTYDAANDGADMDADGYCDSGDLDIDNDFVLNEHDPEPMNRYICGDKDGDGCDDCAQLGFSFPSNDGVDTDGDGLCDTGDTDDDNDGILDTNDTDPLNAFVCGDSDADGCDDCISGSFDTDNDGTDTDGDGICDSGDTDDDNDGVLDVNDVEPFNALICGDSDGDTCDDCASGTFDPANDGADNDADGICDAGDSDDDNDGILDDVDSEPFIANLASQTDSNEAITTSQDSAAVDAAKEEATDLAKSTSDSTTTEEEVVIVDNASDSTVVETPAEEVVVVEETQPTDSTTTEEVVIVDNTSDSTAVETPAEETVVVEETQPTDSTTTEEEVVVVDNSSDSTAVETPAEETVVVEETQPTDSTTTEEEVAIVDNSSDSTAVETPAEETVVVEETQPTDSTTTEEEVVIVENSSDSTSFETPAEEAVVVEETQPTDSTTTEEEVVVVDNSSDSTAVETPAEETVVVEETQPTDSTTTEEEVVVVDNSSDSTATQTSSRVASGNYSGKEQIGSGSSSGEGATDPTERTFSGFGIAQNYSWASGNTYVRDMVADYRNNSLATNLLSTGFSTLRRRPFSLMGSLFGRSSWRSELAQALTSINEGSNSHGTGTSLWARRLAKLDQSGGDISSRIVDGFDFAVANTFASSAVRRMKLRLLSNTQLDGNAMPASTTVPTRSDREGLEIHEDGIVNTGIKAGGATTAAKNNGTAIAIDARNNNYNVTQFYSVTGINEENSNYFLAGAQDNGTQRFTKPGMGSTTMVTGGDGTFAHVDQNESDIQITGHVYNYYFISTDGGATFSTMMADYSHGRFINPSDYDDEQNIFYAAGNGNEMLRVSNIRRGANDYLTEFVNINLNGEQISNIKASPYTSNRLFVGTGEGGVFVIDNADGTPQVMAIAGSIDGIGYVSSIEVGADDSQLIVTFSNYGVNSVYETLDMGVTWVNKEGDLPDMPVRWSLYNPADRSQVMLATEVGVWVTNNFDELLPNWVPANEGLANVRCDMLYYRPSDDLVSIATFGRGLFTSDIFRAPDNENQPYGLMAENTTPSRVDLRWEDNSLIETGYVIQRSMLPEGGFATIGTVGPDIPVFNDLTVEDQATYFYRVAAKLPEGQSEYSEIAAVTTGNCVSQIPTGGTWTASPPASMGAPANSPVVISQISDDTYYVTDVSGGVYNTFWGFNLNQPAELRIDCGDVYVQNSLESGSQFYIVADSVPGVYDDSTQTIILPWFDAGNGFSMLTNFTRNGDGEPEISAAGISFDNVTDVSMDINVTKGNGTGRLVVMSEAAINPLSLPSDGVGYFSSPVFGDGDAVGSAYIVGDSDSTTFSVSNLRPGKVYHVAVFEYNSFNGAKDYLTTSYPTNSQATAVYIILNEFLASPPLMDGDANGDGLSDPTQDEFVELVNISGADLDISNWVISDGFGTRHVLPNNTVLDSATALVVFGGGLPQGTFGGSIVNTASTGSLSLDDNGDQIVVTDAQGNLHMTHAYSMEAGGGQALTRDPDLTGNFLPHLFAAGPGGGKFSPGTKSDGTWFVPPPCPEITVSPFDLVVNSSTACALSNGSIEVLNVLEDGMPQPTASYGFEWLDAEMNPAALGGSMIFGLAPGQYFLRITNSSTGCASELISVNVGFDPMAQDLQTTITDVTSTAAVVNWNAVEADGYSVWYRAGVRLDWMRIDNVNAPYALSDLASGTAYDVRVYPMCGGTVADESSFVEFVTDGATTCDAPVASVDIVGQNFADISWTGEGTHYNIWYRSGKGSDWTKVDSVSSPYGLINLASGTAYEARVYSVCDNVASFPTVVDFTTTGMRECSLPVVSVSDVTDSTARISWVGNNDGYNLWYRGGTGALWTKLDDVEAPMMLEGLGSGTDYEVRVYGICDSIVGTPTSENFMTTGPAACETPSVSVSNITNTSAQVSWIGNSDHYNVWYRTGAGATWTKLLDELHSPVTLTGLEEGTGYEVRVYGFCGNIASLAGSTDFLTEGALACNIPNITISNISDNSALISWTGNGDKYNLWYRAGRGASWTKLWGISGPDRLLTGLASGSEYQLRVYSVCGEVVSDFSERYFNTTGLPYCPTPVVTLDSLSDTDAFINWSGDADKAVVYYRIRGKSWTKVKNASKIFVIPDITPGSTYDVQVWDVCGNVTSQAGSLTFETPFTSTVITQNPDGSMRLSWVQTYAQSGQMPAYLAQAMIEEVDKSLEIYPNPAPGIFQLSANNVDLSQLNIRLFSLAGQEMPIRGHETSFRTFEVQTSAENGIYMLKISSGETEVVRKIVIRH